MDYGDINWIFFTPHGVPSIASKTAVRPPLLATLFVREEALNEVSWESIMITSSISLIVRACACEF